MQATLFNGRTAVVATMHGKETAIAPVLSRVLGLRCIVPEHYDTDLLGTFTGEVERLQDPLSTARIKCLGAMDLTGCDIGIASEGSFGPHPGAFFLPAAEEWLILIDRKNDLEVVVKELSTATNFGGAAIRNPDELVRFAEGAGFPDHGLILRKSRNDFSQVFKGIRRRDELLRVFHQLITDQGSCYLETDMRAHQNPTRMQMIARVAEKLAEKAATGCPSCGRPGFGVEHAEGGLPCAWCQAPTRLTLKHIRICRGCGCTETLLYPDGRQVADPGCCDHCNP